MSTPQPERMSEAELEAWDAEHGAVMAECRRARAREEQQEAELVTIRAELVTLRTGLVRMREELNAAQKSLRWIATPGHAMGHEAIADALTEVRAYAGSRARVASAALADADGGGD